MESIQALITQYSKSGDEQIFEKILKALRQQETIWAAFSPVTRNFFLSLEHGENAAYIFTEKAYFDQFQEELLHKNIEVTAVENKQKNRMLLFADFLRCGITVLIVDNGQHFLGISLKTLLPDDDPDAEKQNIIMNPKLLGKMNYFTQQVSCRRADTYDELAMFHEIYRARYLTPLVQKDSKNILPVLKQKDGKRLLMFFTDWPEFRRYAVNNPCKAENACFDDMKSLCPRADGVVINPFGVNLVLDSALLDAIEQAAYGTLQLPSEKIVMDSSGTQLKISAPTADADAMTAAVAALLKEKKEVNAAYLRMIAKDSQLRPNYLFIIDTTGSQKALYKEIGEVAMPLANGLDLEFLSYRETFGRETADKVKPFYKKRRFRFFG